MEGSEERCHCRDTGFWAALQETRQPCPQGRDELLDTWHTLLQPKVVSAMLLVDERERVRALKGLSRWVASSLRYTSGTIGGIKVDGTTFHHGGFYPAYTTGALAAVASFVALTKDTQYELAADPRQVLKTALLAMRNYCNKYEWGIGISGRHPFGGSMREEDIASFASLALAGDLSGGKMSSTVRWLRIICVCAERIRRRRVISGSRESVLPKRRKDSSCTIMELRESFGAITGW